MGRLIDTSELAKRIALQKKRFGNLLEVPICNVFADMIRDTPTAKAISKADYEAKLKAEKIAMLNDLADEISSLTMDNDPLDIADYIREKINTLKEYEDGTGKSNK